MPAPSHHAAKNTRPGLLARCGTINYFCILQILPERQVLAGPDYKGVVRVRFWRYGRWVDVYIDDRLPTKDGHLIYARDTDPNEFWVSLLEKAYAKYARTLFDNQ